MPQGDTSKQTMYGGTTNTGYDSPYSSWSPQGRSPGAASRGSGGGVIYTGGPNMGKGSSTPAPQQVDPMTEAKAQDWLSQQNYTRTQATANQAKADALAKENAQKAQTQSDINTQYTAGQGFGSTHLKNLGFADTYGIMDRYNNALNTAKSSVPGSATNVSSYFNPQGYWDTAVNEATGAQRGKLNTEFTNFTKPGWDTGDQYGFSDTSDDAILSAILGEQKTGAQDTLKGNLARGQMSQGAYDYALNQLNSQGDASMSNLQKIGGGVLGGYRDKLDTTAKQYGDRVTGYQLGQNVNLSDLTGQLTNQRQGFQGGMRGDILNALGDTKLFDLEKLISSAGAATGASNTPLSAAFTNQQVAAVDPNRTTGTTGIF